MIAEKTAKKNS